MALVLLLFLCSLRSAAVESTAHGLLANGSNGSKDSGWHMGKDTTQSPCYFMRSASVPNSIEQELLEKMKGFELLDIACKENEAHLPIIAIAISSTGFPVKLKILVPTKNTFHEFVKVDHDPKGNGMIVTGYSIEVFKEVMDSLPYRVSYEFYPYENGHSNDMGYYDDLIQQLHVNRYDGVVGDITITSKRSKYGDFTQPYMMSGVSMIVPIADGHTKSLWWFLKPFTLKLWLLIIALLLAKGILVWIFEHKNNPEFRGTLPEQIGKTLSFSFSIFVFAQKETLKSNYSRLIVNVWIFVVFLFVTSYASILQSMLTSNNDQPIVTSIEQLIRNGDYVGYQKESFVYDLLKQMGFQEQKLKSYSSIEEYEIALSRGSHTNGVSAIIDEIPYVKLFLAKYANRFMMVGPNINPSGFGFLFHRGCAIVHDVSRAILNFTEGERVHELEKKWFGSQEPNPSPTQIRYRDIRLSTYDFRGVLLITVSVSGISFLIFIIVAIFRHWQTARDASSNGAIVREGFISPAKKVVPMTPSSKDHDSTSTARRRRGDKEQDLCNSENDTFSIPLPKKATIDRLKKWRQATLVLNTSRRFRYTLDLKKEEEKDKIIRKIRAHTQVVRAALLFKEAGEKHLDVTPKGLPPAPSGDYRIGADQLMTITRDHDFTALQQYGGVKGLASLLKTELEKGIAGEDSELVHRRSVFGANNYPRKKGRSFWVFLWESWQDLTLIILMVAAAVSLALGMKTEGIKEGWYDGGSIAFAVLLVIVVTAFIDYRQSLQFQSLNEEKQNILLEVVRGGRRVHISIFDIVVGDVIPLKIGDQVPADGILISGHSLAIDESSMTGESKIVHKDTKSPFLMSGCKVADGYGDMLVTAVGLNTEWGLLMASISEDTGEETPLQVRLNGVATFIGVVGLTIAAFVLVVLLARYFTGHTTNADGTTQFVKGKTGVSATIDGAVKIVTIAVTIVVVAVPEGLPLAVTLTLAYSMRKMMADKALVRRLSACETIGSATTICSDKTGTLTLNQMTIVEAYVGGKKLASPDSIQLLSSDVSSLLIEGIAQNTTGNVFVPEDGGAVEITGSPTEKAILSWGVKLGMIFGDIKSKSTVLHVFPFNSEKKRGGVALQVGESEVHIHWKGAAEIVLSSCTRWLDTDGLVKPMDQDKVNKFEKVIEDMAAGSLRCVAFAYRLYGMENVPIDEEQRDLWELPEDELVLMAIVGIKDPCRPGVKDAVQLCTRAGVKVRMVTGDNIQTAKAIALECGILDSEAAAVYPTLIEGRTFRALPDKQREEVAEKISVMGRSSPNDKLLLVKALQNRGHVVGVTGDGTNDAPALHEADIGLAMGIQGTEVAKESADIIILDDNFASVVKVVRWGRSVYANIQKVIQFQLTVNVAALIINVVAAVSSGNVPLNAVQLLWVNLIMDTLGALALATEPPTDHLMLRPPVGRSEPLITNVMWRNIIVQALYQVIVLLVLNFGGKSILHLEQDTSYHADKVKNTLIFNSFVIGQVFNEFNARKPDEMNIFSGMTRNHLFMGIIGVTVLLQVLIIEFLGKFAKTVRLSWKLWLVSIAIGVISWPLALIGKLIPVPETPFSEFFAPASRRFRRPNKSRENGHESEGQEDDAKN